MRNRFIHVVLLLGLLITASFAQRQMENLGRGVVATRINGAQVFVSWRLLALDPSGISFNVYRSTAGATAVKLNSTALALGTNYTDASADLTKSNAYTVKPVVNGVEQVASAAYALVANANQEPLYRIPLKTTKALTGYAIKWCWVGDLDGDGEYDFVLDRQNTDTTASRQQYVEAYKRDGTMLWQVAMGANSLNTNNIEPGSSTIDVGHNDGVTVYDFDGDGKAEVALRTSNGVVFGNGTKLTNSVDSATFISILNGMTGAERARIQVPTDFIAAGALAARFGVGYLDGIHPSLIAFMKNRNADKSFNLMECAWRFDGTKLTQSWKYKRDASGGADGHNTRIADIDEDGKDEVCEIGFCLESDGTLKYVLPVDHGDRWYIGKLDPNRAGLQGYGIQQLSATGLLDYYYDAAKGTLIWSHSVDPAATYDVGRGDVGDMDPRYDGYEMWSFAENQNIFNGPTNTRTSTATAPWPSLRIWWDGDLLSESVNETKIEKWNYLTDGTDRLLTGYKFGASMGISNWHAFYGDIIGDWREEVVYVNYTYDTLLVFTSQTATDNRIFTLAQDPAYRNCMTLKGYNQSHLTDFFLGYGMKTPTTPNIVLVGVSSSSSIAVSSSSSAPTIVLQGSTLQMSTNGSAWAHVQVMDLQGHVLQTRDLVSGAAWMPSLPKGVYLMRYSNGNELQTMKVVIP